MKNFKLLIAGLLILPIVTTSCFKKGCKDIDAINYDKKAKRNDGCVYYTKMRITNVKLIAFPTVTNQGTPWDASDNADCYVRMTDSYNNILYQTDYIQDASGELNWTISPSVTITDFGGDHFIEVRDYDFDYADTGSSQIAKVTLQISPYTSSLGTVNKNETGNYPSEIEISGAGATFVLSVSWE